MSSWPYRWLKSVIGLLEKREFRVFNILLFCLFVGTVRMLEEWTLADLHATFPIRDLFAFTFFYWNAFFSYAFGAWLLVRQPWKKTANVVLIGIFLGLFPPLIDVALGPRGSFGYGYVFGFPEAWPWLLYAPERRLPAGEAAVLWLTIFFAATYVYLKTRQLWRAGLSVVITYAIIAWNASVFATLSKAFLQGRGWQGSHEPVLIALFQLATPVVLYLVMQRTVAKGLGRRLIHAAPFVLVCWIGSAFAGTVGAVTVFYSLFLLFAFAVALLQNDYYDAADDARAGRPVYAGVEDMRFFSISLVFLIALLSIVNSGAVPALVLVLVLSVLYSYPYYRAKRFFPANLKMEAAWGGASFFLGVVAAREQDAFGFPYWFQLISPAELGNPVWSTPWDTATLWAIVLVAGGFSVVAALKDAKDTDTDLAAGVQTIYTLALRRHWNMARVHRAVAASAALCFLLPLPLLAAVEKTSWLYAPAGVPFAALLLAYSRGKSSERKFDGALLIISAYLLFVYVALRNP